MRKPRNIQPINREDKAKNSRNRGYVMKYPRIRKEFDKPNRENRQAKKNFQAYEKVFSSL